MEMINSLLTWGNTEYTGKRSGDQEGLIGQMTKSLDEMTDEERLQLFPIILSEYKPEWDWYSDLEKSIMR